MLIDELTDDITITDDIPYHKPVRIKLDDTRDIKNRLDKLEAEQELQEKTVVALFDMLMDISEEIDNNVSG